MIAERVPLPGGEVEVLRPPDADAPVPDSPQQATQTALRPALTEIDPRSGPSSGILEVTLFVPGLMPHRVPGTATGTQTAPAPTATPPGPEPVAPTGIEAVTVSVAGSMRLISSLPTTQRAPAPATMP